MILYTSQPLFVYELLLQGRTWTASPFRKGRDEDSATDDIVYRPAYDWLVQEMRAKGIHPETPSTAYPIWAYHHWNGIAQKKPDLRSSGIRCFAAKQEQVLITVDVPDDQVLISDYDGWHWVLNNWYFGSESECDDFTRRCEAKGVNRWSDALRQDEELQREVIRSWSGIFCLQRSADVLEIKLLDNQTQAVFWELKPEYVKAAVRFQERGKTHKMPLPQPL